MTCHSTVPKHDKYPKLIPFVLNTKEKQKLLLLTQRYLNRLECRFTSLTYSNDQRKMRQRCILPDHEMAAANENYSYLNLSCGHYQFEARRVVVRATQVVLYRCFTWTVELFDSCAQLTKEHWLSSNHLPTRQQG